MGYTPAVVFPETTDGGAVESARIEEIYGPSFTEGRSVSLSTKWKDTKYVYYEHLGLYYGFMDNKGVKGCQELGLSVYAPQIPLHIRPIGSRLAMAAGDLTWGLEMLEIQDIWNQGLDGKNIKVGHLDTGIDAKHPTLRGKLDGWIDTNRDGDIIGKT